MDSQALTAAATFELSGLSPLRNRSTGDEPAAGVDVGRVVGIVTPWDDMQLRNALMALEKPLNPPPGKPPPDPKLGRNEAHACWAFWKVLFEEPEPPNPPKPPNPPGVPEDELGTLTPCCFRHERYAVNPDADDPDEPELLLVMPQPAISSVARPTTATAATPRPNPVNWSI